MAASTLRRTGSLTWTEPLMTFETVPTDTPARSATSFIVGIGRFDFRAEYLSRGAENRILRRWTSDPDAGSKRFAWRCLSYMKRPRFPRRAPAHPIGFLVI